MKRTRLAAIVASLAIASCLLRCSLLSPRLDAELQGLWENDYWKSMGNVEYYKFSDSTVTYSWVDLYNSSKSYSWDTTVTSVDSEQNTFATEEPMYWAWHRDGDSLWVRRTSPGDPEPHLDATWWTGSGADWKRVSQ